MNSPVTAARAALCCVALAALVGCVDPNGSVDGLVTMDGVPVAQGEITFLPEDGAGREMAAAISAGEFHLKGVPPGKKIVRITAMAPVAVITSTEDLAKQAAAGVKAAPPKEIVPANAVGNGQVVTIKGGPQPLEIKLSSRAR